MIRLWKAFSNGKGQKNFIAGTNQGGLTDVENKIKLLTVTSSGSRGRKSYVMHLVPSFNLISPVF